MSGLWHIWINYEFVVRNRCINRNLVNTTPKMKKKKNPGNCEDTD